MMQAHSTEANTLPDKALSLPVEMTLTQCQTSLTFVCHPVAEGEIKYDSSFYVSV